MTPEQLGQFNYTDKRAEVKQRRDLPMTPQELQNRNHDNSNY